MLGTALVIITKGNGVNVYNYQPHHSQRNYSTMLSVIGTYITI